MKKLIIILGLCTIVGGTARVWEVTAWEKVAEQVMPEDSSREVRATARSLANKFRLRERQQVRYWLTDPEVRACTERLHRVMTCPSLLADMNKVRTSTNVQALSMLPSLSVEQLRVSHMAGDVLAVLNSRLEAQAHTMSGSQWVVIRALAERQLLRHFTLYPDDLQLVTAQARSSVGRRLLQ
jgi:hypothetical protein